MRVRRSRHPHRDQRVKKRHRAAGTGCGISRAPQGDFARFEIGFDDFYTTDSSENKRHCDIIYLRAKEKGHIVTRDIEQFYCEQDGRFLPDRYIKGTCPKCGATDQYGDVCESCGATYRPTDLIDPRCAICGSTPPFEPPSISFSDSWISETS